MQTVGAKGRVINREVLQFVNSSATSDGGPSRHSLEVNFGLNRLGRPTRLVVIARRSEDCLVRAARSREDFPVVQPVHLSDVLHSDRASVRTAFVRAASAPAWIIHGYYLWWIPPLVLIGMLLRRPILLMPHGALTAYDRRKSRIRKGIFRFLWGGWLVDRKVTFCVASRAEAGELPEGRLGPVHIMGAGANMPPTTPKEREVGTQVQLLSLSRIAPKKRVDLSIRALAELQRVGVGASLAIVGDGEAQEVRGLRQLIADLDLAKSVALLGQLTGSKKEYAFENADIYLLPSDDENFGISVAEALARGLPVVVSDRVGAAEDLPAIAGEVLASPTAQSIAQAVVHLTRNYPMRRRAAFEYARENFSWDNVASRWASVIELAERAEHLKRRRDPA